MPVALVRNLRPEYQEVDLGKFKRNMESLRRAFGREKSRAQEESEGLARDRNIYPTPAITLGGVSRWDGSAAQTMLRQDMEQNLHLSHTPKELWRSRPEYFHGHSLVTFRNNIYNEEIRKKRISKYNDKRAGK